MSGAFRFVDFLSKPDVLLNDVSTLGKLASGPFFNSAKDFPFIEKLLFPDLSVDLPPPV